MADPFNTGAGESAWAYRMRLIRDWLYARRSHWLRAILMLGFFFVLSLLKLLVSLIALFQFGAILVTGQANAHLGRFGGSLAFYASDLVAYLTCATDELPFPFAEWPRVRAPD